MTLTTAQRHAQLILGGDATHILLEGGSRCVSGDTILDGHTKTIRELAEAGEPVLVHTSRGVTLAEAPFCKGICRLIELILSNGMRVKVTPDHRFWDGNKWVKASSVCSGSPLAVRSSLLSPLPSNSGICPSVSPSGVRRLRQTLANWMDCCLSCFHQYGPQPHLGSKGVLVFGASQFDGSGHIQTDPDASFLAFGVRESNSQTPLLSPLAGEYSRFGRGLSRPSNTDDSQGAYPAGGYLSRVSGQTSEQFQGLPQKYQLSPLLSCLGQLVLGVVDGSQLLFSRFFGLSFDTPKVDGYNLCNVLSVTQSAEENYYTLHVPGVEHYFANGILHHNSGKTFILVRAVAARAMKASKSRHGIFRFRFSHVKSSIVQDTFPKVMETCFPNEKYELNKTDWFATFSNGSEIWFAGLDDKDRVEKVLGREFATIYLNEISQIPFDARNIAVTRLAQKVEQEGKKGNSLLPIRMYYDLNPTNKGHWAYKLFHEKRNPDGNQLLNHPEDYASFLMNPSDNLDNLTPKYLDILMGLSARKQKRFMRGEWSDENPSALFQECDIDKWRVIDGEVPEMVRIVVGVDPSGAGDEDNQDNDAIGIVIGGVGTDGNAYLLEDCTVKAGPGTWGKVATSAYDRHAANVIVGEKNFGGEMVRFVILASRPKTNFKAVTASRGKVIRAEPFSALYEQGKVRHVGYFPELEDELISFSTSGYIGPKSPNRADAWIWVLTELFPGIVGKKAAQEQPEVLDQLGMPMRRVPDQIARQNLAAMIAGGNSWMY